MRVYYAVLSYCMSLLKSPLEMKGGGDGRARCYGRSLHIPATLVMKGLCFKDRERVHGEPIDLMRCMWCVSR